MTPDDTIRSLQEALRLSPENVPLRRHLAETLLSSGRPVDAEREFRQALQNSPHDASLKIGLARAYFQQDKNSHALVIVEQMLAERDTPAAAYLLHARLMLKAGDVEQAVRQYRKARDADSALADAALEERLGIDARDERAEVVDGRLRASSGDDEEEADEESPEVRIEKPRINFSHVGGMEPLKDEIRMKIIHPLTHADMFKAYGKAIGGGILMYGPPGCGKTFLARATAGEVKAGFIVVGLNDVLDMWIGQSERKLHAIFENARAHAPCVLFFDEVDALGASRSDMKQSAGRHLINQFLSELDGATSSNEGVLILGATNAPWHLDAAFRRPGRFDRILFVPPPDAAARTQIVRVLIEGKPAAEIDFEQVAKRCDGFSGADLKAVLDVAIEEKLRDAMKRGVPSPLTTKDLLAAVKARKATTKEWFATARNYALYSNEGGLYDDILAYLKMM
jgi:transitional endoplasmic reticulum ATPase